MPAIHRLPVPEPLRQIPPRAPGPGPEKDPVHHQPVIIPPMPLTRMPRQQRLQHRPLHITQVMPLQPLIIHGTTQAETTAKIYETRSSAVPGIVCLGANGAEPAIRGSSTRSDAGRFCSLRTPVPLARPPDYDQSSARRDHQASAAVIAPSASRIPSPTSPAVAAQCRGTRARAPGSHRYSSRVSGSGAVLW